jgi:cellulose synthase/poly-beta-1,6-N-acetylglucosamine synthase-like glycosyltransferase
VTQPAPLVTVLVPARDESASLAACIDSIAAQDYALSKLEVIVVVDAASRDGSADLASALLAERGFATTAVLRNAEQGTPSNLNVGLSEARGEILCRVDARSRIPPDYVRRCVEVLEGRAEVAVVGGSQVAVAPRRDALGAGIARSLNNRWGMGLSRYRRSARSGAADTVYLGAFRTKDLREVGGWDVAMATNQDFDLNRRLARHGLIWFESGLPVEYVPRSSIRDLYQQYVRFGRWKVRYWRHTGDRPQPRQLALLVGVPLAVAAGVVVLSMAPPSSRAALVVTAVGCVVVFDLAGSSRPRGGPTAHGWAVVASAAVAAGWLGGAWRELFARHRDDG